jgi:ATP-dependent Clp protease ATP-binding subunit ClpC
MTHGSVEQLRDHLDYLLTQLNLTDKEKADRRVAREMAELSADHHRLDELWKRLLAAQEEVHAMEELSILALFEGQDVALIAAEAQRAHEAFLRVLPYALVALEPRRDAATLMIEELDDGALEPWLSPLLRDLPRRGWTAVAHVHGAEKLLGEEWPDDRAWGPPRTTEWLDRYLTEGGKCKNLLLRVKGAYAGAFLALEAGVHRTIPAKKPEAVAFPGDEGRGQHVAVRTVALQFDVPEDAWKEKHLAAPPVGDAHTRRRAPPARILDEPAGTVRVWRMEVPGLDPAAYWTRLEEAALLLLLDFERGARDRDAYFAPPVEDDD